MACGFAWAWMDIRCRYRRSVIGPFWETINVFVLLMGMSFISAAIFSTSPISNIPFIGLGVIAWSAILGVVNEGSICFVTNKDLIKNSTLNLEVYVARTVFRIFITTAHHLLLYVVALLVLDVPFGAVNFLSLLGWVILLVNAFWIMPAFGLLCARFRDLEMVVRNIMQLAFYATPVFWDYHTIADKHRYVIDYNPLFYFIEVIRAPLLGEVPPMYYYWILGAITLFGYGFLVFLNTKMRRFLAFYI